MENEIVIDGVAYIRKDSLKPGIIGNVKIVILQRGWVKVGRFYQDGQNCWLENCSTIRNWGTTKGLGELATGGPTSKTILEPEPACRFHELTIICAIDCEEKPWKKYLQ